MPLNQTDPNQNSDYPQNSSRGWLKGSLFDIYYTKV